MRAHKDVAEVYSTLRLEVNGGMHGGRFRPSRKPGKHFDSLGKILYSSIAVRETTWEAIYEEMSMHGSRADVTLYRVVPVRGVSCV